MNSGSTDSLSHRQSGRTRLTSRRARSQKSSGAYRYLRLLKTTFSVPDITSQTKESTVSFQTQSVSGKNALRVFDGMGFEFIDDDDPNLDETVTPEVLAEEWFKDPLFDPTKPYSPGA